MGQEVSRSRSGQAQQAVASCSPETGVQGAQYIKGVSAKIGQGQGEVEKIKFKRESGLEASGTQHKQRGAGKWECQRIRRVRCHHSETLPKTHGKFLGVDMG